MSNITISEQRIEPKNIDITGFTELTQEYENLPILSSVDELKTYNTFLIKVEGEQKTLNTLRLSVSKPIRDMIDNINKTFEPYIDELVKISNDIKSKILIFKREQDRKERERLEELKKKAEEERAKSQFPEQVEIPEVIPVLKKIQVDEGKITTRKNWTFRFINKSKVPRKYCSPDPTLIRQAISEGVREISGVEIYQEEIIVTKINR
jgi:hypothetical protein